MMLGCIYILDYLFYISDCFLRIKSYLERKLLSQRIETVFGF